MALHINGSEATEPKINLEVGGNAPEQKSIFNKDIDKNSLGFSNNNLFLISSTMGSAYVNNVADIIKTTYETNLINKDIKVTIADKETITHLAYSSVILSKREKKSVSYYIILLPATGRQAKTASELNNEYIYSLNNLQNTYNQEINIFTYDQAIDDVYRSTVENILAATYGNEVNKYISLDGVVLNTTEQDFNNAVKHAGATGINALMVDVLLHSGAKSDLNLYKAVEESTRNSAVSLSTTKMFGKTRLIDPMGQPVRADWTIALELIDNNRKVKSLNASITNKILTRTRGYVDAIPEQTTIYNNGQAATGMRLHPHIIITKSDIAEPTLGYYLLSIISMLPMVDKSLWGATQVQNLDRLGALNKIVNIEGNANGIGSELKLTSKSYQEKDILDLILKMYTLDPIISVDVESFGIDSYNTGILAAAASPDRTVKAVAGRALIDAAAHLTNNNFDRNFPIDEIFTNTGVLVPLGVWASKEGEHDLRDIDLGFMAMKTDDTALLSKCVMANLPRTSTGQDPFALRVEALATLVPDATISGKATRVTFTAKFITALINAANLCGFKYNYKAELNFDTSMNWGIVGNTLGLGGINSATIGGVANEYIGNNMNYVYTMPYSNMGYNRNI